MSNTQFTCQCLIHELHADFDPEIGVDLAFWQYGKEQFPWSHRLRHILRIIRIGEPYADYICLGQKDAKRLADWLNGLTWPIQPEDDHE